MNAIKRQGETPRYINEYLGMSEEEKAAYVAEREAAGGIPTVRLAVNESWYLQVAWYGQRRA